MAAKISSRHKQSIKITTVRKNCSKEKPCNAQRLPATASIRIRDRSRNCAKARHSWESTSRLNT